MASVTALELVNRVRLFRRQPETTLINTPEDRVTLNCVNMAMSDVLTIRKWEFNVRHDGQIKLRGRLDDVHPDNSSLSTVIGLSRPEGLANADVFGDYVVRLLMDGLSDYPKTSIRLTSSSSVVAGVLATGTMATSFSEDTTVGVTEGELHYAEYIMPDTVMEIIRISHTEDSLNLIQADPNVRYDELFPNQNAQLGAPKTVAVGGFDIPTYQTGTTAPDPGLRMAVWPVPDEDYILNYSYYYRHPELVNATDVLSGVPNSVIGDIVLQAASTVMMTWDQNYAAAHFTDLSREQSAAKHASYGGSQSRRHPIGSFDGGSTGVAIERGFPGRTIG